MDATQSRIGPLSLVAILGLASLGSALAEESGAKAPKRPAQRKELAVSGPGNAVFAAEPKDYQGSAPCLDCHTEEDEVADIRRTAHLAVFLDEESAPHLSGCEACHGPGRRHNSRGKKSRIVSFSKRSPIERNRICLQCHAGDENRINYRRSAHALSQVSCEECHRVHVEQEPEEMRETCYGCHPEVRLSFSLPFAHRVEQGVVDCSDCHAQHGGFARQRLRLGGDEPCKSCHQEQAGPFVYEHVPRLFGGCTSCHAPHGSNNARQLVRNDVNATCLECHVNTPMDHDQADKYASCLTCHSQIHGSHVDPLFQE